MTIHIEAINVRDALMKLGVSGEGFIKIKPARDRFDIDLNSKINGWIVDATVMRDEHVPKFFKNAKEVSAHIERILSAAEKDGK